MNKKITFTVFGNEKDLLSNPRAYLRTTQRMKFYEDYRVFQNWKDYVWKALCRDVKKPPRFKNGIKVIVSCKIFYMNKDRRRADPGNIVKGIVDALSDKKHRTLGIIGSVAYTEKRLWPSDRCVLERCEDYDFDEIPRVEVEIWQK